MTLCVSRLVPKRYQTGTKLAPNWIQFGTVLLPILTPHEHEELSGMAWARIDDQAPRHPKMLQAGPVACWLFTCGLCYAQSHLTDGFIPDSAIPMLGIQGPRRARKIANVLVDVGLFERVKGGYQIHDYHDYNATSDEATARRLELSRLRAEAGRKGGLRKQAAAVDRAKKAADEAWSEASKRPSKPLANDPKQILAPSHPIEESLKIKELSSETSTTPRETRPPLPPRPKEYGRLVLHRWQTEALLTMLGPHAEAFDLDAWIWALDTQAREEGLVIDRRTLWPWIQSRLREECLRKGLPVAQDERSAPTLTKTSNRLVAMVQKLSGGSV